ncbi:DUF1963 domain-containing protein [Streptomyces sp. NPDC092952]|uniref:DUF1963 domain-containing protein n=1 Tax=Streptomyces sp. NPDC092952 TaxID=3366018 RepID=UPI0037FF3A9C
MELQEHDSGTPYSAVNELIRARLDAAAADLLTGLVRPSVGFVVGMVGRETGCSIGGRPRSTDEFDWPCYRGRPMVLLAQLDCSQVGPLLGEEWVLPRDGHLLFFHDDEFVAEFSFDLGDDGCRVVHVPAEHLRHRLGDDLAHVVPALPLEPLALPSVPTLADREVDPAADRDVMGMLDFYEALSTRCPAPRHRLLGWCDSTDTPRPKGHRPLLQLEAEAVNNWGEIVNISFWIRDEDLRAGNLSKVRRSYEVA